MLRKALFGVHESASSGEWSHDGQVVGKESVVWHDEQMALLQHRSLYESIASWLQSEQNRFLGKAGVGSERASSFKSSASGAALGSRVDVAMFGGALADAGARSKEASAREREVRE